MQLLALSSELRNFLSVGLPSLEPLMSYRESLSAATDLSPLLLLDPSRSYGGAGSGLTSDARGGVPWELANKGVLVGASTDGGSGRAAELPLSAGLTVLTLFKDAVDALQMQQVGTWVFAWLLSSRAAFKCLLSRDCTKGERSYSTRRH